MELVDFLLARIAEDEGRAHDCERVYPSPWELTDRGYVARVRSDAPFLAVAELTEDQAPGSAWLGDALAHVASFDPRRVLAECEAKRRIVEWHQAWPVLVKKCPSFKYDHDDAASGVVARMSQEIAWMTEREYRARFGDEPPTGPVLRLLTLPYADHPDYREEWKP